MKPIQQRRNECSIASVAILNGLSQEDYEALSDLVTSMVPKFKKKPHIHCWEAVKVAHALGLDVPPEYLAKNRKNLWPTASPERFEGKGIAWVKFSPGSHVVAYENGVFTDSNGKQYPSWEAYRIDARDVLHKRIKLIKTFPLNSTQS